MNFTAPCQMRGSLALVIWPNVLDAIESWADAGTLKFGWFRELNASMRKSSFVFSVIGKNRLISASRFTYLGPRKAFLPRLPKVPFAEYANAPLLMYCGLCEILLPV